MANSANTTTSDRDGLDEEPAEEAMLAELQELESYRREHQALHPSAQLHGDDPDVRRLMEALAFFSLRTRRVAQRGVQGLWRRLCGSYFDHLMSPLPSVAMLQAEVTPRMVDALSLPRGTEVRLRAADGQLGVFTLQADLRVLPLRSEALQRRADEDGTRLTLPLSARFPCSAEVGALRLLVRYPDSYPTALRVYYLLRAHLLRVVAVYQDASGAEGPELPCGLRFGGAAHPERGAASDDASADPDADALPGEGEAHPLSRLRSFFHFPEEELFLHLQVPPSPRPFSRLTLHLDLAPQWPRELPLHADNLAPFCAPIANLVSGPATPLRCDGTVATFPVRHPDRALGFALHSLRGVYHSGPQGMRPLLPAALHDGHDGDDQEGYELDDLGAPRLHLRVPRALLDPVTVAIEALWHQPGFSGLVGGRLHIELPQRRVDGVDFALSGGVRPAQLSALRRDPAALLPLLALRMKPTLTLSELLEVLGALIPSQQGPYRRLLPRLRALRSSVRPDGVLSGSGLQHVYHLAIAAHSGAAYSEDTDEALLWSLLRRVRDLLDTWNAEASVVLIPELAGATLTLPL